MARDNMMRRLMNALRQQVPPDFQGPSPDAPPAPPSPPRQVQGPGGLGHQTAPPVASIPTNVGSRGARDVRPIQPPPTTDFLDLPEDLNRGVIPVISDADRRQLESMARATLAASRRFMGSGARDSEHARREVLEGLRATEPLRAACVVAMQEQLENLIADRFGDTNDEDTLYFDVTIPVNPQMLPTPDRPVDLVRDMLRLLSLQLLRASHGPVVNHPHVREAVEEIHQSRNSPQSPAPELRRNVDLSEPPT